MSGSQSQFKTLKRRPVPACLQRLLLAAPLLVPLATPAVAQEPSGKAWNDLASAQTEANRQAGVRQVAAHALPVPKATVFTHLVILNKNNVV